MIPPKVLVELEMVERMLRSRGVAIDQLQELVDGRVPREALPVLIMALPEVDTPEVRRTIIRALTDRAARGIAARPLIRELARAKAEGDVIRMRNEEDAAVIENQVKAFGTGLGFARYVFYGKVAPKIQAILGGDQAGGLGELLQLYVPGSRKGGAQ